MQSRETASSFTDKPNAFLILFDAFLRKGLRKYEETTGFIRYSRQLFRMLENVVLLTVFDDSGGYSCHFAAVDPLGPENPAWNPQYPKRGFLARWKN